MWLWQKIVAGVLVCALPLIIRYLVRRLKDPKDRILATLSILIPVLLFALQSFLKNESLPLDYVPLHRPWLQPILHIFQVGSESFRIQYEIKNLGQLPADQMRLFFSSPEYKGVDKSLLSPREMAPGAALVFEPNPLQFKLAYLEPYSHFTLAIDYHARVADQDHVFRSVFDVALRREEIKEGSYRPTTVAEAEGLFSDEQLSKFLGFWAPFAR